MAFYITKPGNPDSTILTDGGSLQIGTGLLVNNGILSVTGEGVATDVFFSNILGEPTDNQKLENKELVISSALNDLNNRLLDVYNKEEAEENFVNKTDFEEASLVASAALTDLDARLLEIPNSYYTKEEIDEMIQNLINTYHSE